MKILRVASSVLESVWRDTRLGIRSLARFPGTTAVIVLALALGIGASSAIYSVARVVSSRALPFPRAGELFSVQMSQGGGFLSPTYQEYLTWQRELDGTATLFAYAFGPYAIRGESGTIETFSVRVTGEFLSTLGARPLVGRILTESDTAPDAAPVAVISRRLWENFFASDSSAVGRLVRLGGDVYTLAGVLEHGQAFPAPVDVWVPLVLRPDEVEALQVSVGGRTIDGVRKESVGVALQTLVRTPNAGESTVEPRTATLFPLTGRENEQAGIALLLLSVSGGSLLVIGVANAVGLLLARARTREREIAIRTSLGGTPARIAAQLLIEALLLSAGAALGGVILACGFLLGIRDGVPERLTRQILGWSELGFDAQLVGFAGAVAVVAAIVCGLIPARVALRRAPSISLQEHAVAATVGKRSAILARGLIIGEVALAVTLLLTAGALAYSTMAFLRVDPGIDTDRVAVVRWTLPGELRDSTVTSPTLPERMLGTLEQLPGVVSAAVVSDLPVGGQGFGSTASYSVEGGGAEPRRWTADVRSVSPGFFPTFGIPVDIGRPLQPADRRVAILSRAAAVRHWGNPADAVGERVVINDEEWTIVGVARDVRDLEGNGGPAAAIYLPIGQRPSTGGYFVVRLAAESAALLRDVRETLWEAEPRVVMGEPQRMEDVIVDMVAAQRILGVLVLAYGATAFVITLISLYAVVTHFVSGKRREYGIRLALGEPPRRLKFRAMWHGLGGGLAGAGLGVALGYLLTRAASALLFGLAPLDPLVFATIPALLVVLLALSAYLPAIQAARVDPMTSIRS